MIKLVNCSIDEFDDVINGKDILCFCGGAKFIEFCKMYKVASQIKYLVDSHLQTPTIQVGNQEIPVIRFTDLRLDMRNAVFVITSLKFADEIIEQLDRIPFLDQKECYVPGMFTYERKNVLLEKHDLPVIPKIIHYFWFGSKEIPREYQLNIDTWKRFCPDYEFKKWDESNYDITKNQYMFQAYKAKKWGFVPDYARLDVVNTYGGIYLDTDVEVLRSWDSLLYYDFFCGFERNNNNAIAMGLGFGCSGNNDILKEMMDSYNSIEFVKPDGSLNLVGSPVYQTKVLEKHGIVLNGKTQGNKNIAVFSAKYFSPINMYGYGKISTESFSNHKYAATWHTPEQKQERDAYTRNYKVLEERLSAK